MKYLKVLFIILLIAAIGCSKEESSSLDQKKEKLSALKEEAKSIKKEIAALEGEIKKEDPDFIQAGKAVLVSTSPVQQDLFEHKIDARATVKSRRNVVISAEVMGKITSIRAREGQNVKRGQLLLQIDSEVIKNNIQEVETQLDLAQSVFERQKRLWEKNIGTEIQYLEAKNRKESLESNLKTLKSQLDQYTVEAPFTGTVDEVPVKIGEMASPGNPLMRLVSLDNIYLEADISEAYIGKFKKGDPVAVYLPIQDKNLTSTIEAVSRVVNNENRTFKVEISLPKLDFELKPNQIAVITLTDYRSEDAYVVPTEIIMADDKSKFLYTAEKNGEGWIARKKRIVTGKSYKDRTEILKGLDGNEDVVMEGHRELNDGIAIKKSSKNINVLLSNL